MESATASKRPTTTQTPLKSHTQKKKKGLSAASLESKRKYDQSRAGTRIYIGYALDSWRQLQLELGLKTDADMAHFLVTRYQAGSSTITSTAVKRQMTAPPFPVISSVSGGASSDRYQAGSSTITSTAVKRQMTAPPFPVISSVSGGASSDSYLRTKSENQADRPAYETSSSESRASMGDEYPIMMNSPIEVKQEVSPSPSVQSSENCKEPQTEDAASQILNSQDESMIINQTENNEDSDMPEDEDDEVSISLSVGDGRYLVDLGSSSEYIIDEECILQLFKSCRECNRQCTVRKQVKGLKLVVSQKCCFCESSSKWTNLPDEDDDCS
ncbi:uncharacterized protein [Pagrus major]|uniref:uncharacterized protein n=1 Tax=Pagrus major TaxID=143350 RepID=UPI003CC86164